MDTYTTFFKTLSNKTRLRILNILIVSDIELCVCELTDILEVPTYNISKHLKNLKSIFLVKERRDGRWIYFSINKNILFYQNVYDFVKIINSPILEKDEKELKERLKLRITVNCPIGVQKMYLKKKTDINCC